MATVGEVSDLTGHVMSISPSHNNFLKCMLFSHPKVSLRPKNLVILGLSVLVLNS
jgi:hypothetical protein